MIEIAQRVKPFKSTNNLIFECADYPYSIDGKGWMLFRIGTCEGMWIASENSYDILAVTNKSMNNGHFNDVFDWFENSCKRDKKKLRILEVWNSRLKKHLQTKRGFKKEGKDNLIKSF